MGRIEKEMDQHKYDEQKHADRADSLHQPGAQSTNGFSHSNTPAASSAKATPPRFTIQAL